VLTATEEIGEGGVVTYAGRFAEFIQDGAYLPAPSMEEVVAQGLLENEIVARRALDLAEVEVIGILNTAYDESQRLGRRALVDSVHELGLLLLARWPKYVELRPVEE
jgi:hypothetical protein